MPDQLPEILTEHLPVSMLQALPLLPKTSKPLVLLTRHSIRERAPNNGFASYHLPLTDTGRELAFAWGKYLAEQSQRELVACVSSPIQRCIDTANHMLEGYAKGMQSFSSFDIAEHTLLVEPGSFVVDVNLAGPHFIQQGALQFINAFLRNELPGMKLPMHGVRDILKLLFDSMPTSHHQLLLAVSHDTILAAMFSLMAGHTNIERHDWPRMMEGAFLWFEGETFEQCSVHWLWRGQHRIFKPDI